MDWHPRKLVHGTEWVIVVPGQPEPIAVLRRLKIQGRQAYRAVTWAPTSDGRRLIGYYPSGDAAAVALWRRYIDENNAQHEQASRAHGSRKRP